MRASILTFCFGMLCFPAVVLSTPEHSHYLKPGAPIQISGAQSLRMEPGEQRVVQVPFAVSQGSGMVSIAVKTDSGLMSDAAEHYAFEPDNGAVSIPLTLSASDPGVYYVHFHAEQNGMGRAMALRVQVGNDLGQRKPHSSAGIKTFSAQETITTVK